MDMNCLKNLIKNKVIKPTVIITINSSKYNLGSILKEYKISNLYPKKYEEIYYSYINSRDDIFIINIDINYIDKLKEINKYLKPEIILISKIEDTYTKNIEKKMFKNIKQSLKKIKNNTLIINDNDKYLNKIFNYNLDIYRYGSNIYDDIEYILSDDIIINYQNIKYEIKNKNIDILGYIIISLLFGEEIGEIINNINIEKTT